MSNYKILQKLTELGYMKPINPISFNDGENWIIYRLTPEGKKVPVESQKSEWGAKRGAVILTGHTIKNCDETINYYYEKI